MRHGKMATIFVDHLIKMIGLDIKRIVEAPREDRDALFLDVMGYRHLEFNSLIETATGHFLNEVRSNISGADVLWAQEICICQMKMAKTKLQRLGVLSRDLILPFEVDDNGNSVMDDQEALKISQRKYLYVRGQQGSKNFDERRGIYKDQERLPVIVSEKKAPRRSRELDVVLTTLAAEFKRLRRLETSKM